MKCSYCLEDITDAEDLKLNQRIVEVLGEGEAIHIMSRDCSEQKEMEAFEAAVPYMMGNI